MAGEFIDTSNHGKGINREDCIESDQGKSIEPRLNIKDIDFHLVFVQVNILNFDRDFVHFKQTYQWLEMEHSGAAGV